MKDLLKVSKVASIVSLPKKSIMEFLLHKGLITSSGAITQKGFESGFVVEVRVSRFESNITFDEVYLRITTKGVMMIIDEVCHIVATDEVDMKEVRHG